MPPARGVKSRCSVHNLQTKGEISRESSGGRGRFTPREFREQRFHHRNRSSLFYGGGSIKPPRRFGMSRLGVSGKPGVRRVTPCSGRQMGLIQNNVMKQRLTKKAWS